MIRRLRKTKTGDDCFRAQENTVGPGHQDPQCSNQVFRYTPLRDVDEIRILRIAPKAKSGRTSELSATIHHVYLSDSPLYTAVSWRWGPRQDMVDLKINGRVLTIQANLGRIIGDLQDHHQPRNLWIDAVCIDQNSVRERNHQVKLMGRIYNNANYVCACLMAEQLKDWKRLAKTAKEVHRVFERCLKDRSTASIPASSRMSSEYRLFFENPYFTRRWIIQEIIQARSVTLCCEGYQMPMSTLESMFDDSRRHQVNRDSSGSMNELMDSRAMRLCRLRQEMDRDALPLEELLYRHETAECADFRDQVYALLSLSEHAKEHLPVRYDINRIELMLSVIIVSWSHENLSPFRTLSFACFLKQHLRVKTSDVRFETLNPYALAQGATIKVQGVVRGTVRTYRMSPETEEAALQVRDEVPALALLGRINLESIQTSDHDANGSLVLDNRQTTNISQSNTSISAPGIDQCLFEFESDDSRSSSKGYRKRAIIAGLASRRIDIGDEVWQFERTPLAIIARPTPTGYILFGRAYLLQELSTGCHADRPGSFSSCSRKFEDDLVWVKNAKLHEQLTPVIYVDGPGLLQLMTWATYDR